MRIARVETGSMTPQYPQIGDIWEWYGYYVLFLGHEEIWAGQDDEDAQRYTGLELESGNISSWVVTPDHLRHGSWTKVA